MIAFRAIILLTIRSAMRSNVFRTLCALLVLTVIVVPLTVVDDGTAKGFIQLILQYSLSCVMAILCASAVWLTCSELCSDVETGQIHLIAVKRVSRATVLAGKLSGVIVLHAFLMFASAVVIYALTMAVYSSKTFSENSQVEAEMRGKVEREVFTARRVYAPDKLENLEELVQADISRRYALAREAGFDAPKEFDGLDRRGILELSRKSILASQTLVKSNTQKVWNYSGLPDKYDGSFIVRYKLYKGEDAYSRNQATTMGMWGVKVYYPTEVGNAESYSSNFEDAGVSPEIVAVSQNEFTVSPNPDAVKDGISPIREGRASIAYVNFDPKGESVNFQQSDGPFILIEKGGFFENYLRTVLLGFMGLVALVMITGAFAAFLSLPTALFITVCYMLISFFATYQSAFSQEVGVVPEGAMEAFGFYVSSVAGVFMIRIQDFFASSQLSNGELVEFSLMLKRLFFDIFLRGMIFLAAGAFFYTRRELGTASKR